jgi:transcriptional regulator with XRE-family HTH domain
MRIGEELRAARERAGLTPQQIADRSKIRVQKIEALENGELEALPRGIYLDGVVRAYAEQVAIDPAPLLERVRQARAVVPVDAWDGIDAFPSERSSARETAFSEEAAFLPSSPPVAERIIPQPAPNVEPSPDVKPAAYVESARTSRFLEPARHTAGMRRNGAGRLAVALATLILAAGLGAYLSIANAPPPRGAALPSDATAPGPMTSVPDRGGSATQGFPAHAAERTTEPSREPNDAVRDVSGSWRLATRVESSSYTRYQGLHLGYDIRLRQEGDRVTGAGRKITENDAAIAARGQTPISLAGRIDGHRLVLTFNERGSKRPTQGKFDLQLEERGTLRGRFSSTAARSSGTVDAYRLTQ